MSKLLTLTTVVGCVLAVHTPVAAQETSRFWLGAGVGAAAGRVGCDICSAERDLGPSAQLRAGYVLGRHLQLGLEANGWTSNDAELGVRDVIVGVAGLLYWYPSPDGPRYHLKAGLGPVWYRAQDSDVPAGETAEPAITSNALGIYIGVGYDLPVGGVAVTPFFNLSDMLFSGALRQQDTRLADVNVSLIQVGVAVRWQP